VRKQAAGVAYFENRRCGDAWQLKQARYAHRAIDVNVTFIPGDYVADGLIDLLRRHDFDFDAPTYFIWEGNTMYLPRNSVKDVLEQLKETRPAGSGSPSTTWPRR